MTAAAAAVPAPATGARGFLPYGLHEVTDEDVRAVVAVLRGGTLAQGPAIEAFEEALARRSGARYAVAVSSGTAALLAACHAAGLGPGDEAIVPAITFAATAQAPLLLGASVRIADVDPRTGLVRPESVLRRVTARARAVLPVDFAGSPHDVEAIRAIARRHGLAVIEDASHALGAIRRGRPVGALADLTTLSFHPVKHVTTGEGGAVLTDDRALRDRLVRFRDNGLDRSPAGRLLGGAPWAAPAIGPGLNLRLSDLGAALGRSQLARLDRNLARRRALARRYDAALRGLPLRRLAVPRGARSAWHLYVVAVHPRARLSRAALYRALRAGGIGVQVHYPPLSRHPHIARSDPRARCPGAEAYYRRCLTLPLFPAMTDADVDLVAGALRAHLG